MTATATIKLTTAVTILSCVIKLRQRLVGGAGIAASVIEGALMLLSVFNGKPDADAPDSGEGPASFQAGPPAVFGSYWNTFCQSARRPLNSFCAATQSLRPIILVVFVSKRYFCASGGGV